MVQSAADVFVAGSRDAQRSPARCSLQEAAHACPQIYDKTTKKVDLAAVQTDVMQVCSKVRWGG